MFDFDRVLMDSFNLRPAFEDKLFLHRFNSHNRRGCIGICCIIAKLEFDDRRQMLITFIYQIIFGRVISQIVVLVTSVQEVDRRRNNAQFISN